MTIHLLHRPGRHRPRPWRHLTVGALIASIAPSLRVIAGRARHAASERPESGVDEQFVETLHGWNVEDADTDHLYDVLDSAALLAPLDASYRGHAEQTQARIDAVNLAFAGGAA